MARKFALYLKDGHEVRNNIEEIAEYFDYGKMVEYFHDGSLLQWLEDCRYEKEAIELSTLKANTSEFKENLCCACTVLVSCYQSCPCRVCTVPNCAHALSCFVP